MKKIIKYITLLALLVLCLTLAACGTIETEMAPYLSVSYTGYNGNGTAHVDFDFADFEYAVMSQWKEKEQNWEKLAELTAIETTISCTPATLEGLCNGDTFTVTLSVDEAHTKEYGYRFTGMEKTFTVEGLPEPVEIDPFDPGIFGAGMTVDATLTGIDPFIILELRNHAALSDPIGHITYTADKDWNLKNGDVITVTAAMDKAYADQGYLLTRTETTICVEGFGRYVSAPSDLTGAALQAMADRACQDCAAGANANISDGSEQLTPWGATFANIHTGSTALLAVNNSLQMEYSFLLVPVYKTVTTDQWYDMATGENTTKTWNDVFSYYKFTDVILHADGSIGYNDSYVDVNGSYTDMATANAQYLDQFRGTYTFLEVPLP